MYKNAWIANKGNIRFKYLNFPLDRIKVLLNINITIRSINVWMNESMSG